MYNHDLNSNYVGFISLARILPTTNILLLFEWLKLSHLFILQTLYILHINTVIN